MITGGAGRLGRAAARALTRLGWLVRVYDRVGISVPDQECIVGDLGDTAGLERAFDGVSAVIHLAATPDDDDFETQLLPNNVLGLYHVLEAARLAGVKRVVLASTGQVNWWQQFDGPWPVSVEDPISPRGWYSVTKVAMEAAGQTYARNFGITVIAARLGWCPRTRAQLVELEESFHGPQVYFSPRDAGNFFAAAVHAEVPAGYHLVFAASLPRDHAIFDLVPAKRLLAWEPLDRWPDGAAEDVGAS